MTRDNVQVGDLVRYVGNQFIAKNDRHIGKLALIIELYFHAPYDIKIFWIDDNYEIYASSDVFELVKRNGKDLLKWV